MSFGWRKVIFSRFRDNQTQSLVQCEQISSKQHHRLFLHPFLWEKRDLEVSKSPSYISMRSDPPNHICLLKVLISRLFHLSPCSLSVLMSAISCSPALFADGRDERDGAGWLLGYWALSTNGRPRQGCFHAPPPRRQPSEQHSHLSAVFVFPHSFLHLFGKSLTSSFS